MRRRREFARIPDQIEAALFAAEIGSHAPEIDLHGMDKEDAVMAVESLIQDAFMQGERVVKIIHGRGTGALRDEVQRFLKRHKLVEAFRDSQQPGQLGGVTLAAISSKH